MIDERMEEQASLHVLGALDEAEAREFERAMQADPELQAYVARLSLATGALAGALPAVEPPPQLRAKVLASVAPKQKMVALPERKRSWLWRFAPGLAAAALLIVVMLSLQNDQLRHTVGAQAQEIDHLNQLAQSLEAATNNLQQTVIALQETNRLANLKIAMLNSLMTDAPKTVAVSLWDESKQEGVFVVQNLKQLPADRDYQLWVLDNGTTPVDAGVFHVDANGGVRVEFKAKAPIQNAGKFAVTEEAKGGVASPTIANMVLASN
jgi:anti-sigma-K factor RskA